MNKLRLFSLKHLHQPLPLKQNYRNSQMCIQSHKSTGDNEEVEGINFYSLHIKNW